MKMPPRFVEVSSTGSVVDLSLEKRWCFSDYTKTLYPATGGRFFEWRVRRAFRKLEKKWLRDQVLKSTRAMRVKARAEKAARIR